MKFADAKKRALKMFDSPEFKKRIEEEDDTMLKQLAILREINSFGFLTLENRLNVAFSRSQKLLIVVGDGEMLSDDFAKTYVEGLHDFYTNLSTNHQYGNRIQ